MGRLADEDWKEMSGRLRSRVARLMKQLDAGTGYREQIEKDVDARLKALRPDDKAPRDGADDRSVKAVTERVCGSCATANDSDARFCKGCGAQL